MILAINKSLLPLPVREHRYITFLTSGPLVFFFFVAPLVYELNDTRARSRYHRD